MTNKKYNGFGVYVSTGNGFKAPIDAIFQNLKDQDHNIKVIDFFSDLEIKFWDNFWKKAWKRVLKRPIILKIIYFITTRFLLFFYREIHYRTAKKRLLNWLDEENPDYIITSHFITTILIPYVVEKSGKRIAVFAYNAEVINAHVSNLSKFVQRYFSPTPESTKKLVACGQPAESIRSTPFPINKNFISGKLSTIEARKKLGLEDMFTITISFGGDGIGSASLVETIAEKGYPLQVLVVCGHSRELKDRMEAIKTSYPSSFIHVYGFVDNMPELMSASDICAGKTGMNAVFESIYMGKPFMATSALFNERATLDYVLKNGFGWEAFDTAEQIRIIESCLDDPGYYNTVAKKISSNKIDFAAEKYANIIKTEVDNYKIKSLRDSKALYFDMAGTLCDIPISDKWDKVNRDGILKVIDYLKWESIISSESTAELADYFVNAKKEKRKDSKTSLQEAAIRGQISDFIKYAEDKYPIIRKERGLSTITAADMDAAEKLFVSTELDITVPFEGVVPVLEKLSERYDMYLLSNNVSRQLVLDITEKIGCAHCFKETFVSVDCGYRKPHKNFLDYVTEKTKLRPSECVMIGDRLTQDIQMANLYDLKAIYVSVVDHEDNKDSNNEHYDYFISEFKELEDIFLSLKAEASEPQNRGKELQ